jgi:hypothetical protein
MSFSLSLASSDTLNPSLRKRIAIAISLLRTLRLALPAIAKRNREHSALVRYCGSFHGILGLLIETVGLISNASFSTRYLKKDLLASSFLARVILQLPFLAAV